MIKRGRPRGTWLLKCNTSIAHVCCILYVKTKSKISNLTKPTCRIEKKITVLEGKIEKMEMNKSIKEDMKTVALGTSKINYLDPRITVAWCKRHEVPIEKVSSSWFWATFVFLQVPWCKGLKLLNLLFCWQIFNKSLIAKFGWAMDVDPEFRF